MNDFPALLQEQIKNLTALHALNKVMDEELNLLIEDAQQQLSTIAAKGADQWYAEKDPVKAEHHKHQTRHEVKHLKHDFIKTVHTRLHGRVSFDHLHPEHSLPRLHAQLRKHLQDEKKRLHKVITETHKQLLAHHKQLPAEEAEKASEILSKTKQLHDHIKNKTLPYEQIEEQLHNLHAPYQIYA